MMAKIEVQANLLSENDRLAAENRRKLTTSSILTINVMASPGAGKTSLIARTVAALGEELRIGVIEGDIASSVDADRLAELGIPTHQINTGGDCHLEARHVAKGLGHMPLDDIELLFIENVGNLVCPTGFDLGEAVKLMVASVAEGDDKPIKYPAMFQAVDVVVLNKIDLLGICPFDRGAFFDVLYALNPDVAAFEVSCLKGKGISEWAGWLKARCQGRETAEFVTDRRVG
jgi:hydrogenase nickel incorporation protein HypB